MSKFENIKRAMEVCESLANEHVDIADVVCIASHMIGTCFCGLWL